MKLGVFHDNTGAPLRQDALDHIKMMHDDRHLAVAVLHHLVCQQVIPRAQSVWTLKG